TLPAATAERAPPGRWLRPLGGGGRRPLRGKTSSGLPHTTTLRMTPKPHTPLQPRIGLRPAAGCAPWGETAEGRFGRPPHCRPPHDAKAPPPAAAAERAPPGRWLRPPVGGGAEGASGGVSYPIDDPFAEQALRADQQERERQHVREPGLDAAADHRADVDLGQLLAEADDQAADDGARN